MRALTAPAADAALRAATLLALLAWLWSLAHKEWVASLTLPVAATAYALAYASLRSRLNAVRERTALARSLFFHEFLALLLFQIRDYLTSLTSVVQHLERAASGGAERELAGKLARTVSELRGKLQRMSEAVSEHTTTRRPTKAAAWALSRLLRDCLDSAASSYPVRGVKTRLWVDPRLPPIAGDRDAAAAAFNAAFENALEAFLAAGRGGRLTVSAMLSGEQAVVEVMDDAGGILEPVQEQLFRPLFTTKSARGGVGLGLAMARRLLERGGGTMAVRSEAGRAFVRIELPLKPGLPRVRNEESTWAGRRSSAS